MVSMIFAAAACLVLIAGFVLPSIIVSTSKRRYRALRRSSGKILIVYSPRIKIFACVLLGTIGYLLVCITVAWHPPEDFEDWYIYGLMFGMLTLLEIPLWIEFFGVTLLLDADGIESISPWRSRRYLRWSEITDVTFSGSLQWFRIRNACGRIIRAHTYLRHLQILIIFLEERTPWGLNARRNDADTNV